MEDDERRRLVVALADTATRAQGELRLHMTLTGLERALAERDLRVVAVPELETPLLVRGPLPPERMAIVGARATDAYGLALARQVARDAVALGFGVVSGGAEGCDRAAHEAALACGGRTVVVLPCGHDHPYPRASRAFFDQVVASGGAVVSGVWPTVRPTRWGFLWRNRLVAGLARALVVVRACRDSGSLSAARAARELGRRVGAVPGAVGEVLSDGCHFLLEEGARPIVSPRALADLLEVSHRTVRAGPVWPLRSVGQPDPWPHLARDARTSVTPAPARSSLGAAEIAVLEHIRREPGLDLDAIGVHTRRPIAELAPILLSLELDGWITRQPGGRFAPSGA